MKVTRHFGKPERVEVGEIQIPDLWHIAMRFREAERLYEKQQETKSAFKYPDDYPELDEVTITIKGASAKIIADEILETWGIAHDLQQNILQNLIKENE